jgi:hypothetical protein
VRKNSEFWAITCYYAFDDPRGEKRRLDAYREFRRRFPLPLVTVELSREGSFDLKPGDAEVLIQLQGGDLLWQKERLLNIALEALPSECDTVAWTDCDVVLTRSDWPNAVRPLLDDFRLIQPFQRLHFLARQVPPGQELEIGSSIPHDSAAVRLLHGTIPEEYFLTRGGTGMRFRCAPGMIWVAKRETLAQHGFYDCLVLGGGDKATFSAACGRYEDFAASYKMSARHQEHYQAWACGFFKSVDGRIGCLDGDVLHLWHGDLASRHYSDRYTGFDRFVFDPEADLVKNSDGVWRWGTNKPEMHAFVREYFARRQGLETRSVVA